MAEDLERLTAGLSDRYRFVREIGRGAMGSVLLAEDLKHHRQVAIKVLQPEVAAIVGRERFLREIETSARLTHPNILPLHDSGEVDSILYYVMPYVEGETVRHRIRREGRLAPTEAVQIAIEVADALDYAHRSGIVHRDIKPENILLSEGHAVVADFGVARPKSIAGAPSLTSAGHMVGTPLYMSPEQITGDPAIDGRSDIYALGCVLYEMLAGEPPFGGASVESIVRRHLAEAPKPLDAHVKAPPGVAAIVQRALAKDRTERFQTAGALAAELRRTVRASTSAVTMRRRRQLTATAAAVIAVAIIVWLVTAGPWHAEAQQLQSIAVLPLENLSPDSTQEYFADGMTEAIIADLAHVGALKVISRTSIMRYKNTQRTIPEIGRELGVDAIIEGTVLRIGDRVRITTQLIEVESDRHLWADTYEREIEDVLGLQREIARAVANEVHATLTPQERARLAAARPVHPEAYEAYLRGRFHWNKRTPEGFQAAIREFRTAADLDTTYAAAYSGLADSYILLVEWQIMPPATGVPLAHAAAAAALQRDSMLAEAWTSMGEVRVSQWNWSGAETAFRRALELNPGYPTAHQWYGFYLSKMGQHREAIAELRRAVELDPLSLIIRTELARVYYHARLYEEANTQLAFAANLDSTFPDVEWMLGLVAEQQGRHERAADHFRRAGTDNTFPVQFDLAQVVAAQGDTARAAELVTSEIAAFRERGQYLSPVLTAIAYGAVGNRDRAFGLLEGAYDRGADDRLTYLAVDPTMDVLRDDPRFDDLMRRMRFPNRRQTPVEQR